MSHRAAVILLKDDQVAMIERHRQGMHYFVFPGGHVERGETPEQAAVREAKEELGVEVVIKRLVARLAWQGKPQYYYLAEITGGEFGTGYGREMRDPLPERGTYQPIWMPLSLLDRTPVLPHEMVGLLSGFIQQGWPDQPVVLDEP